MDWAKRGLLAAGAAAALDPSMAWADSDRQPLWEVRVGAAKVFLFGDGTFSAAPWTSARIEAALDQSAVFWKETPEAPANVLPLMVKRGIDPAAPLSTWLTPKDRDRVAAAAATVGMTWAFLAPFRPWLAGQALNSGLVKQMGANHAAGAATVMTGIAQTTGKPVRTEFADYAAVIDLFSGFSRVAEVQYLLMAVDWIESGKATMQSRSDAWAAGDLSLETPEVRRIARVYPELYQAYLVSRNLRWAPRFRAMLDGGGTTFVLVGGDHLVGPDSVLAQLEAAGMRARRV